MYQRIYWLFWADAGWFVVTDTDDVTRTATDCHLRHPCPTRTILLLQHCHTTVRITTPVRCLPVVYYLVSQQNFHFSQYQHCQAKSLSAPGIQNLKLQTFGQCNVSECDVTLLIEHKKGLHFVLIALLFGVFVAMQTGECSSFTATKNRISVRCWSDQYCISRWWCIQTVSCAVWRLSHHYL